MISVAFDLANNGKVVRGMIGIQGEDLTPEESVKLSTAGRGAVRVTEVTDQSPAAKGGLRKGDIIIALEAKAFESWNDLRLAISRKKPGESVVISYLRGGRGSLAHITIIERPAGN